MAFIKSWAVIEGLVIIWTVIRLIRVIRHDKKYPDNKEYVPGKILRQGIRISMAVSVIYMLIYLIFMR